MKYGSNSNPTINEKAPHPCCSALFAILLTLQCLASASAAAHDGPDRPANEALSGHWIGEFQWGVADRSPFSLDIQHVDGKWEGSIYTPYWGDKYWSLRVLEAGQSFKLQLVTDREKDGFFEGSLKGGSLAGTYSWHGTQYRFGAARGDGEPGAPRKQIPHAPFPYTLHAVSFSGPAGKIAGGVIIPAGEGHHAAVVLLPGSKPFEWDPQVPGKPRGNLVELWVLADYLGRAGIATLRLDSRGMGGTEGKYLEATYNDLADDVSAAVKYLKSRPDIDAHHVGVMGWSQGGQIASLAASRDPAVDFVVMMGGPAVPMDQMMKERTILLLRSAGIDPEQMEKSARFEQRLVTLCKSEMKRDEIIATLTREQESWSGVEEAKGIRLRASVEYFLQPMPRSSLRYDPQPVLSQVKQPILAIFGSDDIAVPASMNVPAAEKALSSGISIDPRVVVFPGLGHEFRRGNDVVDPSVLQLSREWIVKIVDKH